jgi:hypothetical protein
MVTRYTHFLLVLLAGVGFLFQSMWAGVPSGHGLCLGCDNNGGWGWTISKPCVPGVRDCCDEDHDADEIQRASGPAAHGSNECGCVDVPLNGSVATAVSGPARADLSIAECFKNASTVQWVPAGDGLNETHYPPCWARAGPMWITGTPPRMLTPMARMTVLTV